MASPGLAITHWQGSVRCVCRAVPPHLENIYIQQNRTPHKPHAQPGRSTQRKLHHTCFLLQSLGLTLQWSMAYQGLATHTLAGLCALWLPSSTSTTAGELQHSAKLHPYKSLPAQPDFSTQRKLYHNTCWTLQNCI